LNQKLDLLTDRVQYLTEQAQLAERQRQDRAELVRDLTPIVNDAFRLTTEQLEEVKEYVNLNDLLRLLNFYKCYFGLRARESELLPPR
jgi:hypothetical protein